MARHDQYRYEGYDNTKDGEVLMMMRMMVLVRVGGVNTSVQCVDLMLEVIPGPQWTTAFGSIYIKTATCYGRLWTSGSGDTTHALR